MADALVPGASLPPTGDLFADRPALPAYVTREAGPAPQLPDWDSRRPYLTGRFLFDAALAAARSSPDAGDSLAAGGSQVLESYPPSVQESLCESWVCCCGAAMCRRACFAWPTSPASRARQRLGGKSGAASTAAGPGQHSQRLDLQHMLVLASAGQCREQLLHTLPPLEQLVPTLLPIVLPAVVDDLLSAFLGLSGCYIRAKTADAGSGPHLRVGYEVVPRGQLEPALQEMAARMLPIWWVPRSASRQLSSTRCLLHGVWAQALTPCRLAKLCGRDGWTPA